MVLSGAAAAQGDSQGALQQIRAVAADHPHAPVVWNAYARAVACSGSMRSALRYLASMRQKHPESIPLMLLLGNSHTLAVSLTPGTAGVFQGVLHPVGDVLCWPKPAFYFTKALCA